jgi:hypothetical protein
MAKRNPMFEVYPLADRWSIRWTKSGKQLHDGLNTIWWEVRESADAVCKYLNGPSPEIDWKEVSRLSIEAYDNVMKKGAAT